MRAVRDDAVAGAEILDAGRHLMHHADIAVAERDRLAELGADGIDRGHQPVRADLVQHLRHLLGLLPRLK